LKRDKSSILRNPKTIDRICGRLYEMGLDKIFEKCSDAKETNRQMGGVFRRWINKKALGILPVNLDTFMNSNENAILDGVLYIKGKNKMYTNITTHYKHHNIMSALVLREFLYQV